MTAIFARADFHEGLAGLKDRHLLRNLAYIDGRWVAGNAGKGFDVADPATGTSLAWVAAVDTDQVTTAINAASRAFPKWQALLPQERAKFLRTWYDLMLAHREDLALIMTLEQGKPLAESRGEIDYAASFVEWYAEEGKRLNAESVTSHLPGAEMMVRRQAIGVAGLVTPWNFPCAMLTRKASSPIRPPRHRFRRWRWPNSPNGPAYPMACSTC
jgi:aspartate-semialdehyde dehydrogenase